MSKSEAIKFSVYRIGDDGDYREMSKAAQLTAITAPHTMQPTGIAEALDQVGVSAYTLAIQQGVEPDDAEDSAQAVSAEVFGIYQIGGGELKRDVERNLAAGNVAIVSNLLIMAGKALNWSDATRAAVAHAIDELSLSLLESVALEFGVDMPEKLTEDDIAEALKS